MRGFRQIRPWCFIAIALVYLSTAACKPKEAHEPLPEAFAALKSDAGVLCSRVAVPDWDNDSYYVFQPKSGPASTGFVFYGGANCDARAYAPLAREIARAGFMMALVEMPGNTSMRAPERAVEVIAAFPEITAWAVGGHSMGGISASQFAKEHPADIDAVVLWASYPSTRNRLDATSLKALSISATNDGIYPPEAIDKSRATLPPDTVYVVIQGGNHQQFGWYTGDHKPFDGAAAISREDQSEQIVAATVSFLQSPHQEQ